MHLPNNSQNVYHISIAELNIEKTSMHDETIDLNFQNISENINTAFTNLSNKLIKFIYLGNGKTLPIIISNTLNKL